MHFEAVNDLNICLNEELIRQRTHNTAILVKRYRICGLLKMSDVDIAQSGNHIGIFQRKNTDCRRTCI